MITPLVKPISLSRFNALATYARNPRVKSHSEELEWFETFDGKVLGILLMDTIDNDYAGIIFARDLNKRFRFVDMVKFDPKRNKIKKELLHKISKIHPSADEIGVQGDESAITMDFFTNLNRNNTNPDFLAVKNSPEFSAAKNIIEPLMRWYTDIDGNFVEQFQSTGFQQRIWEILLFSIFTENNCIFDTNFNAPDFNLTYINGLHSFPFAIEATTVNKPLDRTGQPIPMPEVDRENVDEYKNLLLNYFPTRYSGPLLAKLRKKYWEQEHVAGKPLVIAISDCQFRGAGNISHDALPIYLYGFKQEVTSSGSQNRTEIVSHIWGTKEVPSGFFNFEDSENISAVIFSPSSDIDKFNRMGLKDGFNDNKYKIKRTTFSPIPKTGEIEKITRIIPSKKYMETWDEGLKVYHNPNATHPFPMYILPNATHYNVIEGMLIAEFNRIPVLEDFSEIVTIR
ncbi:hypothetical protein [Enterobacter asburiae]|uniref:hypothetical protein n=1 Tax=Enterobacter asburiae TaxID=61645 RepID=UPI0007E98F2B|nr:hypothetical protein [Enterobacter asburiae]MCK7244798.1 hypothetical protein [Enterobacter asburiae]MCK7298363.1 hypothetical protein [Enterobacter asburiae]OAZ95786.1 hypothetical protein A9X61_12380 [Enterobacter asburiae]